MKILITGSEGFIGQHLHRELQDAGHIAFGFGHDDASDDDSIRRAIESSEAEAVVHLANRVEQDAIGIVNSNIGMTAVVAKACGELGVRFVYASSGSIYGDNGATVCDEFKGPFKLPSNIHGLSKRFGEALGQFYAPNGFTTLRFSALYGPRLPLGRSAIVDFLWDARSGKTIPVHVGAERSWCWIGDAVRAVRLAIEHGEGPFNVARDDDPRTLKYVAEIACGLTGADKTLIEMVPLPERRAAARRLGTSRIRNLGWTPRVSLYDGMEMTLKTWVNLLDEEPIVADSGIPDTDTVLEVR